MKEQRGFSLIEVLIATVVFAIGTLALLGTQLVSIKTNKASYEFLVASTLVEQKIEEIRAEGASALIAGSDSANVDALGRTKDYYDSQGIDVDPSNFIFKRTWTIDPSIGGNQTILNVKTTWQDKKTSQQHSVFSKTIIHTNP